MRYRFGVIAPLLLLFPLGCAKQFPADYAASKYTRGQITGEAGEAGAATFTPPAPIQAKIDQLLHEQYPPPWAWSDSEIASDPTKQSLRKGQQLYQKHCIHCHGLSGAGDGPTSASLVPRPRDFRRGIFKWKSTSSRAKPTREDLLRVLKEGANGTSMPPFMLMPADQLDALADYVVYLSKRGELERELLLVYSQEGSTEEELKKNGETLSDSDRDELIEVITETAEEKNETLTEAWETAKDFVVEPEETDVTLSDADAFEASVARGKELYLGSNSGCTKCHGVDGRAQTKLSGADSLDIWGNENAPRNLTLGLFRGGRRPVDVYRRVHEGIAGSSMPSQGSNPKLTKKDIWDLVNFVRVLPDRPEMLQAPAQSLGGVASQVTPGH
ncbi:cytochrome c [bacterium]|nr:cytochrome c [bacterium]